MRDMMQLVEPLIPGLRRYARALLRDASAADDLVQDCLERAIDRWHQRRADADVRAWMFTILHNLAMTQLQQRKRRGRHIRVEDVDEASLAQPPRQEGNAYHANILEAVNRLPEDQRAVLLLVSLEDLSYAETAQALGIPVGTVMSRLSRAREHLRLDLAGESRAGAVPYLRSVK